MQQPFPPVPRTQGLPEAPSRSRVKRNSAVASPIFTRQRPESGASARSLQLISRAAGISMGGASVRIQSCGEKLNNAPRSRTRSVSTAGWPRASSSAFTLTRPAWLRSASRGRRHTAAALKGAPRVSAGDRKLPAGCGKNETTAPVQTPRRRRNTTGSSRSYAGSPRPRLSFSQVVSGDIAPTGAVGTPTLILPDQTGRVLRSQTGQLKPA